MIYAEEAVATPKKAAIQNLARPTSSRQLQRLSITSLLLFEDASNEDSGDAAGRNRDGFDQSAIAECCHAPTRLQIENHCTSLQPCTVCSLSTRSRTRALGKIEEVQRASKHLKRVTRRGGAAHHIFLMKLPS